MTAFRQFAKPAMFVVAIASMMSISGTAQAGSGWLWFDSVFAAPTAPSTASHQPAKRAKIARAATQAPAPRPILVSAAAPAEPRSNCFWCSRSVFISGLSF